MNPVEKAECEEIKKMSNKVKDLHVRLEQLKKKKAANQSFISDIGKRAEKTQIFLKDSQITVIKDNLTKVYV